MVLALPNCACRFGASRNLHRFTPCEQEDSGPYTPVPPNQACTEWRPRHAAWRYGRHGGAAIDELIVSAMTLHVTAVLVLTVAVVGVGCEKRDPIVAEYSSVGSGRPD